MNADLEQDRLKSAAAGVVALRLWLGAWFLLTAALKLPVWGHGFDFPTRLKPWLQLAASEGAYPGYQVVVEALAKYAAGVTWVVATLEIGIGVALVLGWWTRAASFAAIVLYANYWLASARMGYATAAVSLTIGVSAACLFIANAGMFWGVDGLRARPRAG